MFATMTNKTTDNNSILNANVRIAKKRKSKFETKVTL